MKTISGNCVSTKPISLSKAAKILSKFVSAENGASQVIGAYLHRASVAFNELNQLHKELKLPHSHKKKHKKHKTEETHDDSKRVVENSVRNFETSQEMNHGHVQSKNKFSRQRFVSENAVEDGKKSTQTDVKFSQELNGQNAMGSEQKETEMKLCKSVEGENGGLVGPQDLQIKKKKKYELGSENKLYAEAVQMEQRKKRKNEVVEGRLEDRAEDLSKKRMKRKHEGDH